MKVEYGLNRFGRFTQGELAKIANLENAQKEIVKEQTPSVQILESRSEVLPIIKFLPEKFRKPLWAAATLVSAGFATAAPICGKSHEDFNTEQVNRIQFSLPFADSEVWYLTGGPHSDGLSGGVRYAVDFAPTKDAISCPDGEAPRDMFARASGEGKVIVSGNENDETDEKHSVVAIEHPNGIVTGYMHLDNIQVEVGDMVGPGDALGIPSCESPPGGSTRGVHLHFFAADKDGFIPIRALILSGWKIRDARTNYNGTMEKYPLEVRTADTRRCGPDEVSIRACGGIRNDISAVATEGYVITAVPTTMRTFRPAQTPTALSEVSARQAEIDQKFQEAEDRARQFVELLLSGTPSDLQQALEMQIPYELRHQFESYSTSVSGGRGGLYDIQVCAAQMRLGEFQRYSTNKYQKRAKVDLSETDKLNIERGLYPRERYAIAVDFTFRPYDTSYGRLGFRDYDALHSDTYLVFEEVGGGLYIASNRLCFKSPVGIKVAQDPFRD